jgi:hypothetical protein
MEAVKERLRVNENPGYQSTSLTVGAYAAVLFTCVAFIVAGVVLASEKEVVTVIEVYLLCCA